jgi:hypothetical protein
MKKSKKQSSVFFNKKTLLKVPKIKAIKLVGGGIGIQIVIDGC